MNKKIISVLLAAAMLLTASACSGNEETQTTTSASSETTTTTTTTELTSGTTSPEEAPDSQPTTDEPEEDDADASEQTDCQKLTDAVLKDDAIKDWATMQVEADLLKDVMNYNLDLFDDFSVVTHLMSSHLIEITVVTPKDGQEDAVLEFLEGRKEQLINEVAFYPNQLESAEKTIVGSYNGFCYLLCFETPEALETALKAAIDSL